MQSTPLLSYLFLYSSLCFLSCHYLRLRGLSCDWCFSLSPCAGTPQPLPCPAPYAHATYGSISIWHASSTQRTCSIDERVLSVQGPHVVPGPQWCGQIGALGELFTNTSDATTNCHDLQLKASVQCPNLLFRRNHFDLELSRIAWAKSRRKHPRCVRCRSSLR